MSNYTKTTNFATKDNLSPGNPLKIVKGTEIDTEYNNIATAVATKTDNSAAAITGGTIVGITDLAVADGGTGASTAAGALNNLLPSQTSAANKYLQSDGTNASWDAVSLSTADITGTLGVTNGGTGVTTSTGTTNVVLSNSPTLVTPALGTPSAAVLTNATGLPISTGVSGLATGVATFLGTPSSANLASAITDETGTGALVFASSPTLVTPALGTPSALVGTNITGTASGLTAGSVTTNANLTGDVTSVGNATTLTNAPVIAKVLTGYVSGAGTVAATDSILQAIQKLNGNDATNANLTGAVTSVGNATSLGSFSSANLLGALTDETGTGSAVFATSPTLVTPILGTPTSATLTNATGLPLTTGVTGQLPVANGGTGTATPSIVAGTNVTVTGTWPNQTIAASSGGTPGGSTTQVQYNNAGAFGGITGATTNGTALTLVAPVLGTPASATLTNATGLPLTTGVTGTLPVANGGTNLTSFTSGGVVYASSSSALATGSALTFDGSNLSTTGQILINNNNYVGFKNTSGSPSVSIFNDTSNFLNFYNSGNTGTIFYVNAAEQMRLTSTGLGIGTTTIGNKLTVADNSASAMIYGAQSGAGDIIALASGSTERFRITNAGNLLVGTTTADITDVGCELRAIGRGCFTASASQPLEVNRLTDDGELVNFRQDTTVEGNISVSGTTVSYNGGHLSRWAQTTAPKDNTLVKGTVLSNLDAMNVYTDAEGNPVDNEQLNKVKMSDTEGDANVAGVFVNWTYDEDHNVDEINMAMTGDMIIRIAQGVTVVRGDLLMSAGDGTAKPQGDDIVRSKTVAKVTSNHITCTYADGSYCVPCVLMAC